MSNVLEMKVLQRGIRGDSEGNTAVVLFSRVPRREVLNLKLRSTPRDTHYIRLPYEPNGFRRAKEGIALFAVLAAVFSLLIEVVFKPEGPDGSFIGLNVAESFVHRIIGGFGVVAAFSAVLVCRTEKHGFFAKGNPLHHCLEFFDSVYSKPKYNSS